MNFRVGVSALMFTIVSAGTAVAQTPPPQGRQTLTFKPRATSRVVEACKRAVGLNLNGPATTGDVDEACDCVDRAYVVAADGIPAKWTENHIWNRPEGEVINPYAILLTKEGELVPGPARIVADRVVWDVRVCLGTLPTRGQLIYEFARDWTDAPNQSIDYLGPIVAPRPGPAAPMNKELDGLLMASLAHVRQVMNSFFERTYEKRELRQPAFAYIKAAGPAAEDFVVLSCRYRTEAKNGYNRWMSSRAYFYWYKPTWSGEVEKFVADAPAEHPVKVIGAARDSCPLNKPAD